MQKNKPCAGNKFKPVEGSMSVCRDNQEVKIQESMQTLGMGSIPRSIVVVLEDDLVVTVKAGSKCEYIYICRLQAFLIRKLQTWNCISVIRHRHYSSSSVFGMQRRLW